MYIEKIMIPAILILGVLASLVQFFLNNSLWEGVVNLTLNIVHRSHLELLQPLDYFQVAPILFLQIEKVFSHILPDIEMGLQLFPLLCFWMAIYLLYRITKKWDSLYAIVFALSFFVLGYTFMVFSNMIKQYITDVLVVICFFYFITHDYKKKNHKYYILGIAGVIAIFLSNVAPIILFSCGVYLVYDFFVRKAKIIPLIAVFLPWLGSFLLYYHFFIHNHPTHGSMVWMWEGYFLPTNPFKADFYAFVFKLVPMELFTAFFSLNMEKSYTVIIVCGLVILFVFGLIRLIRDKKINMVILACVPVLLHLFLSAFQLYPFNRRLILYLTPGVIIVCAWGFDFFAKTLITKLKYKHIEPVGLFVILIPVLFSAFLLFNRFPIKNTGIKESIKYMEEHIRESKNIYVYGCGSISLKWYKDIGFLSNEMDVLNEEMFTQYHRAENLENPIDTTLILNELASLRHKNWIMILGYESDEKFITSSLNSLGFDRLKEFHHVQYPGAVYLYDFGE